MDYTPPENTQRRETTVQCEPDDIAKKYDTYCLGMIFYECIMLTLPKGNRRRRGSKWDVAWLETQFGKELPVGLAKELAGFCQDMVRAAHLERRGVSPGEGLFAAVPPTCGGLDTSHSYDSTQSRFIE